jgi:hypothetical protein
MTNSQSPSLSWNKAPIGSLQPDFYYCQTLRVCWYRALPLMTGQVCSLQLLLALTSAAILRSKSHGTRDQILLSQIQYFLFRCLLLLARLQWRYSTPPPHGVDCLLIKVKVKIKVTLRLAVYCQSVCLGIKPLETHNQRFFSPTEPLWY